MAGQKLDWDKIVPYAASIVNSYDTGVTLRQLFYRLVSAHIIPNTQNAYKGLSRYTARARREGWFPDLIDRNRAINRYRTFTSSGQAVDWLRAIYRRPRDENQEWSIYVGVEKSGIVEQLTDWFGDLGIPIVALGGYSSQSYVDEIVKDVARQQRPGRVDLRGRLRPERRGHRARLPGARRLLRREPPHRAHAAADHRLLAAAAARQGVRLARRRVHRTARATHAGRARRPRPERSPHAVPGRDRRLLGRRHLARELHPRAA
jgi:hypothetical protein